MNQDNLDSFMKETVVPYMQENLQYFFGFFLLTILCLIVSTHSRWNRIAKPFRTHIKLGHHDDYDSQTIQIDGRNFKNLLVIPVEQGLYIAHWGLLPQIMMPKRVLIPWQSLSDIYQIKRSALGFTVSEHFVDTRSSSNRVQLKIPRDIAEEILNRGFLKSSVEKN